MRPFNYKTIVKNLNRLQNNGWEKEIIPSLPGHFYVFVKKDWECIFSWLTGRMLFQRSLIIPVSLNIVYEASILKSLENKEETYHVLNQMIKEGLEKLSPSPNDIIDLDK